MKRSVMRSVFSLVCSIVLLTPCIISAMAAEEYIPLVLEQTEGFEYAGEAELDAVWAQTGNTETNDLALDGQTVHSGSKSLLLNDTENNKSLQAYGSLYQSNKAGTEFILTAYYNVEQLQGSVAPSIAIRSRSESSVAYTYSTGKWERLSVIRGTSTKSETLRIILSSGSATVSKVYFDDVTVSVLTEALALDYIEEKLAIAGTPDLPVALTSKALSLQNLESAFMDEYTAAMVSARKAANRALTKSEVQACIDDVNSNNESLVAQVAAAVPTTQTISQLGDIALPTASDSSVTLAWTAVTGDTNNRIQMLEGGPELVSQPDYGGASELVTMTLTVSKGPYSAQVNVTTTINPYSKNMAQLVEVADQLDFNSYLNGQDPNWVTSDLTSLPSYVTVGTLDYVTIKWKALDANTLGSTGVMTNKGVVTCGAYGTPDTTVILRATLSKLFNSENVSYSRDFYLTVPSMSAEDGRNMITENPGFESAAPTDGVSAPAGWLKHTVWTWEKGTKNVSETNYAQIDKSTMFNGAQSLRITVDKNMADGMAQDSNRTAGVQNEHIFTAREGHLYTLKAMVLAREIIDPSVSLVFLDNEGVALAKHTTTYTSASKSRGIWKSLTASACAPAGTVMVAVELDGGSAIGTSWFDDVCLRELPLVANGSFDLGTTGWTTSGTAGNGALTLNSGVTATSAALPANRGVAYYLTVEAQGSGTAALRFLYSDGTNTVSEYAMNVSTGTNTFYAYAPANTGNVSVVLTGGTDGLTVEDVKITHAPSGTYVEDGGFEFSATEGKGSPWDRESATVGAATGRTGAGLTISSSSGSARSNVIPIMDGKSYTFTADVKGTGGAMTIELYRTIVKATGSSDELAWSHTVTSASSAWNTISYTFDQIPEGFDYDRGESIEYAYARVCLSGAAVFDNVAVYSVTDSVSNSSMENINYGQYGSFPYNWSAYGTAAGFVANQEGQATEGIKSLGVELFGLGEGGVRSSMVRAEGGNTYEATIKAKGSGLFLTIEFWDENFARLDSGADTTAISGQTWTEYTVTGTAPASAAYVSLSVNGSGSGLAYVDEASIVNTVRTIGSNVQIFLDDWLIKDSTNVQRTLHAGEKDSSVKVQGWYGTVLWNPEKQLYEMWHQISGSKLDIYSVYYRYSTDGKKWSEGTLCHRLDDTDIETLPSPTVFLDLDETDASRRYKMVCHAYGARNYALYFSPDGINWTKYGNILPGSDVVKVTYDAVNREYVATFKTTQPEAKYKRVQNVAVSKDLINWTVGVRMYSMSTPQDVLSGDYFRADSYSTGMYALGDSYVAINWLLLLYENEGFTGEMKAPLLFSRDLTEDWQRIYDENGNPFMAIPLGEPGAWDDAQIYSNSYPVQVGDETWWYYDGTIGGHFSTVPKDNSGYISVAKWRRNGFASMDFGTNGVMTTEQFILASENLHLNAKGNLTVQMLDKTGAVLATAQFAGDSVDEKLVWDNSVAGSVGQPVSLKFTGSNAQLYSLQMTHTIEVSDAEHGTVTVDRTSVAKGDRVTVTAAPEQGYRVDKILVDGVAIEGNVFFAENDHTVTATFVVDALFFDNMEDYTVGGEFPLGATGDPVAEKPYNEWDDSTETFTYAIVNDNGNQVLSQSINGSAEKGMLMVRKSFGGSYTVEFKAKLDWTSGYAALVLGNLKLPQDNGTTKNFELWMDGSRAVIRFPGKIPADQKATSNDGTYYASLRDDGTKTGTRVDYTVGQWYTFKVMVNETAGTVTVEQYNAEGELEGWRTVTAASFPEDNGTVGLYSGAGTNTVYFDDISVKALYPVTVKQPAHGTINVTANGVAVNGTDVFHRGTVLTITAAANNNYVLKALKVNGKTIATEDGVYTYTVGEEPVTIAAAVWHEDALYHVDFDEMADGAYDYTAADALLKNSDNAGETTYWTDAAATVSNGVLGLGTTTTSGNARLTADRNFSDNYQIEARLKIDGGVGDFTMLYLPGITADVEGKKDDGAYQLYIDSTASGGRVRLRPGSQTLSTFVGAGKLDESKWFTVRITANQDINTLLTEVIQDGEVVGSYELTSEDDLKFKNATALMINTRANTIYPRTTYIDYITVTDCSYTSEVVVMQPENGTITVTADGAVVKSGSLVGDGTELTITVTPDAGYALTEIKVDGASVSTSSPFNFTVEENVTISAELIALPSYNVSVGDNIVGGTVTLSQTGSVLGGTTITVTATATKTGYAPYAIYVNGEEIVGNSFILTEDAEVTAVFWPEGAMFYEDFSSGSVSGNVFTNIGAAITDDGANTLSLVAEGGADVLAIVGATTTPAKNKGALTSWTTDFAADDSYQISMRLKNNWNNSSEALIIYLPGVEIDVNGTNKYYALWLGGVSASNSHLRLRQRPGNATTGGKTVSTTDVQADEWFTLKFVVDETVTVYLNGTELTGLVTGNEVVNAGEHKLVMDVVDGSPEGTATTYVDYIYIGDVTESEFDEPACEHTNKVAIGEYVAPTCTTTGMTAGEKCADCGVEITAQEEIAAGHDLVTVPAQEPTTEAIGWNEYQKCSRCDYTEGYVEIPKLDEPDEPKPELYTVTVADGIQNGTVTVDVTEGEVGTLVTVTATGAAGTREGKYYDVLGITVNGEFIEGNTFEITAGENVVSAVFGKVLITEKSLILKEQVYVNVTTQFVGFDEAAIMEKAGLLVWNASVAAPYYDEAAVKNEFVAASSYNNGFGSLPEYKVKTNGISAKAYADELYLCAYIELADGVYAFSNVIEYSVQQYCQNQLKKDTANEELKQVCAQMLHYGAAAQAQFTYNTDDLANDVTKVPELANYPAGEFDMSMLTDTSAIPTVAFEQNSDSKRTMASLLLRDAILMKLTFNYGGDFDEGAGGKAEMMVWYDKEGALTELTEKNVSYVKELTFTEVYNGKREFAGETDGIPAKEYGNTLFACARFTDAEGKVTYGQVSAYSVETYAKNQINKTSATEALKELCRRMVVYGEAAQNYFDK